MALSEDVRRRAEERRERVAAMTAEECLGVAALLRDVLPKLETERQRKLAQEMAERFEKRAALPSC